MEDLSEVLDQRTNELLRLEKEAEIAQTDRTTEELIRERLNKQVLDLKECLKTYEEARGDTETKLEETKEGLKTSKEARVEAKNKVRRKQRRSEDIRRS